MSDPVRTLVVRGLDWPVVAAGLSGHEGCGQHDPVVVVRANRVVAASPVARAEGVAPGQRRREAQGRCPDLTVVDHDADRDVRAFAAVAAEVEVFTPRLELSRPGVCALATRGPSRYFGGDDALASRIHRQVDAVLAEQGWPGVTRVGVADGPFAADLASEGIGSTGSDGIGPTGSDPAVRVVPPGGAAGLPGPPARHHPGRWRPCGPTPRA